MLRSIATIFVLLVMSGCASSDPWTRQDTIMQSLVTASYVVDAVQTTDIHKHADIYEDGFARPFIGTQPSSKDTYMYFATVAISSYFIARALPAKWRPFFQGAQLAVQGSTIASNCALGLGRICEED